MLNAALKNMQKYVTKVRKNKQLTAAVAVAGAALLVVTAVKVGRKVFVKTPQMRLKQLIESLPENDNVVHLFTFPQALTAPSMSPFGVRVETYCKINRLQVKKHFVKNPYISPTECLPFVIYNREIKADSNEIIMWLADKLHLRMDSVLNDRQRALGKAIRSLCDYGLLPGISRSLMIDDKHKYIFPYYVGAMGLPLVCEPFIRLFMRSMVSSKLNASGYNKLSKEQYVHLMLNDIQALESALGDKFFFFGDRPCSVDCVVFSTLLTPYRLYFLTHSHPPRQSTPITYDLSNEKDESHKTQNAVNNRSLIMTPDEEVYINEALQYLVDSVALGGFIQRMCDIAFPSMDMMLAPSSPTRAQRDIATLVSQMEEMKHRIETRKEIIRRESSVVSEHKSHNGNPASGKSSKEASRTSA